MPLDARHQKIIMDHYKHPRNFGKMAGPAISVHNENPACGDRIDLQAIIDERQRLAQIRFHGRGCAISQASASMMTEFVKGKTIGEAQEAIERFESMLIGDGDAQIDFGDLKALSGVKQFPLRVKCATLAWTALEGCLKQAQ
jgi:nitrogen fixation NifU-like protein